MFGIKYVILFLLEIVYIGKTLLLLLEVRTAPFFLKQVREG